MIEGRGQVVITHVGYGLREVAMLVLLGTDGNRYPLFLKVIQSLVLAYLFEIKSIVRFRSHLSDNITFLNLGHERFHLLNFIKEGVHLLILLLLLRIPEILWSRYLHLIDSSSDSQLVLCVLIEIILLLAR